MLRNIVLAIALAWFAIALLMGVMLAEWIQLVAPAVVIAGIVWERFSYKGNATAAAPGDWRKTGETFLDDETGRPVTVWFNATTGERKYVDE